MQNGVHIGNILCVQAQFTLVLHDKINFPLMPSVDSFPNFW